MTENFNILVHKLNTFRIKYYSFKLLKGILFLRFSFTCLVYNLFINRVLCLFIVRNKENFVFWFFYLEVCSHCSLLHFRC
jgi:hypothetical protein